MFKYKAGMRSDGPLLNGVGTASSKNMSNCAWLAVLALAFLRNDAPAGSAPRAIALPGSHVPKASYCANSPNSGVIQAPGNRRNMSVHSASQPIRVQRVDAVAHQYSTSFADDENPISEGGSWINGKAVGLDWADVRTVPGLALGVSLPSKYADPTAVLTGDWGSDQQAEGTVTVKTPLSSCCHEVELRLRSIIAPHSITGYEIVCSVSVSNPYLEIVRWNGPLNDFTYVSKVGIGCVDGDILKAVAVGDIISVYKNGAKVLEGKDQNFTGGSPGIGFYEDSNDVWNKLGFGNWRQFGFSRFSATDDLRAH
jgi:hypothetical protein